MDATHAIPVTVAHDAGAGKSAPRYCPIARRYICSVDLKLMYYMR